MTIQLLHTNCMDYMRTQPDNAFDLAIVDPPYGIGQDWKTRKKNRTHHFPETTYQNQPVDQDYFDELKRICQHWIIWGWNYYTEYLGSTNYLICWDKGCGNNQVVNYSQFELAATNIRKPAKHIRLIWDGYRRCEKEPKIHPHQKPIKLYEWLLLHYASPDDRILDTHLGSASSAIAAHQLGFDFVGCEIDTHYYNALLNRFKTNTSQGSFFLERV